MNRNKYRGSMIAVAAITVAITAAAFCVAATTCADTAQTWVQVLTLALSVPASIGVLINEQRREFTTSVRDAWPGVVEAVHQAIDFTHKPSLGSWEAAVMAMSRTIDNVRVVFGNQDANRHHRGLYPVEALHRINRLLNAFGPGPAAAIPPRGPHQYKAARRLFVRNMKRCQAVWSSELGGTVPGRPDTIRKPIKLP